MALALMLGRQGLGRVAPNPSVGCVIVKNGQIVGRGRTADGGRPHAEVVALAMAGDVARGATAYVTLEPCSHHGKSGPCADALVFAGITRVVVATGDPNPLVAGQGIEKLRAAGITVDVGLGQRDACQDHAGFFLTQTENRPFVTLKLATTIDGRIATARGESQWITGPQARRAVHMMRARHDAVMVGGGTVRADNPTLNVRGIGVSHQPARVVVSNAPLLAPALEQSAEQSDVFHCHGGNIAEADWATGVTCRMTAGQIDLDDAMQKLAGHGLTRVFCEGGGELAASLLRAGLVDELVTFQAGMVMGGDGLAAVGPLAFDGLADAPSFTLYDQSMIGPDVMLKWRRA